MRRGNRIDLMGMGVVEMGMGGSSREGRGETELREGMWGETDRTKGYLRNNMET